MELQSECPKAFINSSLPHFSTFHLIIDPVFRVEYKEYSLP